MPRFYDKRTWNLLENVPPHLFSLVRGALSLRQKVVFTKQSLLFLKRCKAKNVLPNFITNKKIGEVCNLSENHPRIQNIYQSILNVVIKQKQHLLYSTLLKCVAKEDACKRYLDEQSWRRIEGGSRRICESIRSNAKSALCAKFDRLLDRFRVSDSNAGSSLPVNHQSENISPHNELDNIRTARVTVLGSAQISDKAIDFLSLGPSFAVTQNINAITIRKVVGGLQRLRDQLRVRSKRNDQPQLLGTMSRRVLPPIPFPCSFYKEPDPCPDVDIKFRILSSGILSVLTQNKRRCQSNLTYDQWQGFREIREMISAGMIRLSVSDKGGEFVVIPQELDREITELHLTDTTIYQRTTQNEFHSQCKRLNHIWTTIGKAAGLSERFLSRLKIDNPNCPVFYSMIKTHKLSVTNITSMTASDYKIRPIVSCVGGPTDRISWFLNKIVSQLLPMIPSHLTSTRQFLTRLHNTDVSTDCVIESFDVASLYTNVSTNDALQALNEMLSSHERQIETYGLSRTRIMTLIKECLNCNIFKWSGRYFSQIRGLAMGQRLAPVLAICFMSKIEEPVLARIPLLYCRYIDDCCVITSTQSEMDECFRILNEQSQYIRLTRETPRKGWLPFLNTQLRLSNGMVQVKWFRKESSKNIILHARSAHPVPVKRAVIRNMFKTAIEVCSGEAERQESKSLASIIMRENGYVSQKQQQRKTTNARKTHAYGKRLPLCIPFVSDRISNAIRQCLIRAQLQDDVVLVNIPNDNIKRQLVRNRLYDRTCLSQQCVVCPYSRNGDCTKTGVIYQIECLICHATYIGETGRPLYVRINEHLASKRRRSLVTPLGKHRHEDHSGDDFDVRCTILAHEPDISARKTLEAFWISVRDPKMNNRNEHLSITTDLMPFISLCGV
ncbi:hypothetical protein Y032_0017g3411 [Ancylostoma ceylanicum]|uniref:Reverse transcriptase domain-containing protein n=1 Tax=Ancylostoma ceylanicum TaxID=53326 RepID=A0A016V4H5_9BILA|nr:hypothetical protein Y032_0017g3411 [Ancylostoma ceylanicum]